MLRAGSQPPQSICSLRNAEMTSPQVRRRSSLSNVECGGKAAVFCIIDIVRGRGYIDELCVLPAWRGNDLGTRLLSWAIASFDATGVDDLELMVVEGNEGAMLLCERFCFLPAPHTMRRWPYGQK